MASSHCSPKTSRTSESAVSPSPDRNRHGHHDDGSKRGSEACPQPLPVGGKLRVARQDRRADRGDHLRRGQARDLMRQPEQPQRLRAREPADHERIDPVIGKIQDVVQQAAISRSGSAPAIQIEKARAVSAHRVAQEDAGQLPSPACRIPTPNNLRRLIAKGTADDEGRDLRHGSIHELPMELQVLAEIDDGDVFKRREKHAGSQYRQYRLQTPIPETPWRADRRRRPRRRQPRARGRCPSVHAVS